jgi:ubiquinol-cytochrome c reductase cytochrome b subunit
VSVLRRLVDYVDDRTGIKSLIDLALVEPVPGGARLRYVFGSVLTYLFMQQVVLGVLLATYYSPSATDAWASTAYLQDQVSAGWFLRGLHHHSSSAMVVLVVLHLLQVVIAGAYRKPREFNWWIGLAMGGLVLAFALSGYLLPWDQKGYWATKVATNIMGSVPLVGEVTQSLLQGGNEYGNLTITRFYALHVFVLPGALGALLVAHIALFRRHGVTAPASLSEEQLETKKQWFWPDQLFIDVLAMAVTGAVLVWLTYQTHGAELYAPADPASNFVARPEWYFLFLFQLLKYFEGPLQIIATVIIPGGATLFLFALPFVDRAKTRKWKKRMPVLSMVGLGMGGVVALTAVALVEDGNNEEYQEGVVEAHALADRARELALEGVLPEGGVAVWRNDPRFESIENFKEHCSTCHSIDPLVIGGEEAPNLTDFSTREWLVGAVREPRSLMYFGGTKAHTDMEAYAVADLPEDQLAAVVEYIVSLRADPAVPADATLAKQGKVLWDDELECNGCHEVEKGAGGGSPNFFERGNVAWIERVITDSSGPDLYEDGAEMPKFGKKLSKEQIHALAVLVHEQGLEP